MTDDGSKIVQGVVHQLLNIGWKITVIQFFSLPYVNSFPKGVATTVIDIEKIEQTSDQYIEAAIKTVAQRNGAPALFIHFHPQLKRQSPPECPLNFSDSAKETILLKQVFFMAKHLSSHITQPPESDEQSRCAFLTVARLNGSFGLRLEGETKIESFSATTAGLFGLVKTLQAEWPSVFCRAIDLHPQAKTSQAVDCILAELHDSEIAISEVSYRTSAGEELERFTLTAGETA